MLYSVHNLVAAAPSPCANVFARDCTPFINNTCSGGKMSSVRSMYFSSCPCMSFETERENTKSDLTRPKEPRGSRSGSAARPQPIEAPCSNTLSQPANMVQITPIRFPI